MAENYEFQRSRIKRKSLYEGIQIPFFSIFPPFFFLTELTVYLKYDFLTATHETHDSSTNHGFESNAHGENIVFNPINNLTTIWRAINYQLKVRLPAGADVRDDPLDF